MVRPVRPVLADDRARPVGVGVALLGVRVGGVLLRVDRRLVPPDEPVRRQRQPQLVRVRGGQVLVRYPLAPAPAAAVLGRSRLGRRDQLVQAPAGLVEQAGAWSNSGTAATAVRPAARGAERPGSPPRAAARAVPRRHERSPASAELSGRSGGGRNASLIRPISVPGAGRSISPGRARSITSTRANRLPPSEPSASRTRPASACTSNRGLAACGPTASTYLSTACRSGRYRCWCPPSNSTCHSISQAPTPRLMGIEYSSSCRRWWRAGSSRSRSALGTSMPMSSQLRLAATCMVATCSGSMCPNRPCMAR